jgi:hypothetical protein
MIFVVQVLTEGAPQCWFAFDEDDLVTKLAIALQCDAWALWDCCSARELLALFDTTPDGEGAAQRYPGLHALGIEHGWDTPLYRADALLPAGTYQPRRVTPLQACVAALQHAGGEWRLYRDEDIALHAADAPDPLYDRPGGWRARCALRQQLIAVEALADDH